MRLATRRSPRPARHAWVGLMLALAALLAVAVPGAFAAGPQPLPAAACNDGTQRAGANAPNRASSEGIPHIEHSPLLPPVPYCHHFNPTASLPGEN
jgi:hypothetical protein